MWALRLQNSNILLHTDSCRENIGKEPIFVETRKIWRVRNISRTRTTINLSRHQLRNRITGHWVPKRPKRLKIPHKEHWKSSDRQWRSVENPYYLPQSGLRAFKKKTLWLTNTNQKDMCFRFFRIFFIIWHLSHALSSIAKINNFEAPLWRNYMLFVQVLGIPTSDANSGIP